MRKARGWGGISNEEADVPKNVDLSKAGGKEIHENSVLERYMETATYRYVLFIQAITHDAVTWLPLLLSSSTGICGSSEMMGEAMLKKESIACGSEGEEEVAEGVAVDEVVQMFVAMQPEEIGHHGLAFIRDRQPQTKSCGQKGKCHRPSCGSSRLIGQQVDFTVKIVSVRPHYCVKLLDVPEPCSCRHDKDNYT